MDALTAGLTDNLFNTLGNQSNGMETLANQALSSGITRFQNEDYAGAAKDFKRAFGMSPYSNFAYEATKYGAMAYQAMGDPDEAVRMYEQAISVNQTDDRLHPPRGITVVDLSQVCHRGVAPVLSELGRWLAENETVDQRVSTTHVTGESFSDRLCVSSARLNGAIEP